MPEIKEDHFEQSKRMARGEILSKFAGKVAPAKIAICFRCTALGPIIDEENEMVELHWREWLIRDGWKERGKPKRWYCPNCAEKDLRDVY